MLATVPSRTSASRLKKSLTAAGVKCNIIQTPSVLTKEGCGYSLRFDERDRAAVIRSARELRINIRAFYAEEDGRYVRR